MPQPDDPKTRTPVEIDDTEDRMGSVRELDFSDRQDEREGRAGTSARPKKSPRNTHQNAWPKAA